MKPLISILAILVLAIFTCSCDHSENSITDTPEKTNPPETNKQDVNKKEINPVTIKTETEVAQKEPIKNPEPKKKEGEKIFDPFSKMLFTC